MSIAEDLAGEGVGPCIVASVVGDHVFVHADAGVSEAVDARAVVDDGVVVDGDPTRLHDHERGECVVMDEVVGCDQVADIVGSDAYCARAV